MCGEFEQECLEDYSSLKRKIILNFDTEKTEVLHVDKEYSVNME